MKEKIKQAIQEGNLNSVKSALKELGSLSVAELKVLLEDLKEEIQLARQLACSIEEETEKFLECPLEESSSRLEKIQRMNQIQSHYLFDDQDNKYDKKRVSKISFKPAMSTVDMWGYSIATVKDLIREKIQHL